MSVFRSDDPSADFNRHEARAEAWLRKRPVCCFCGEHIQGRRLFDVEGKLWHRSCFIEEHEKDTEDYIA